MDLPRLGGTAESGSFKQHLLKEMTMTARSGTRLSPAALFAALVMMGTFQAQAAARDADGLPYNTVERAGNIEYVTGGIGEEAEQRLGAFATEHGYNLKLLFTLNAGNYVADVDVTLKDHGGRTLVQDVADGPFLLAKVPAGLYTVVATYSGKTESRKIRVGTSGLRVAQFRWPADPQTDFTFARDVRPGTAG
jgi:hypothetical protein